MKTICCCRFIRVGIVAAVFGSFAGCGGKAAEDASSGTINPDQIPVDQYRHPKFVFPKEVLTGNKSLDEFIIRFTQVCIEGKYDEYRLLVSRKVELVPREQFEKVYQAVKRAEVKEIRELPRISELPYPLWVVISEIHLRKDIENPVRRVMVLVFQEKIKGKQEWVLAPAPRALRDVIPTTQPLSQPTTRPTSVPTSSVPAKSPIPARPR